MHVLHVYVYASCDLHVDEAVSYSQLSVPVFGVAQRMWAPWDWLTFAC